MYVAGLLQKLFLLVVFCFVFYHPVGAQTTTVMLDSITEQIHDQKFANSKEATFIAFILKEQQAYRSYLERLITVVSSIVVVIIVVVGFFTYRSFKDLQNHIKTKLEKYANQILEEELQTLKTKTILPIKREIQFLQAFQQSHILFVGEPVYKENLLTMVLGILNRSGISQLTIVGWPSPKELLEASMVVYLYPPSGNQKKLESIIKLMSEKENKPLLLYTDGRQDLSNEYAALAKYKWYAIANMPLTLLEHLVSAARLFYNHESYSSTKSNY